MSFACINLHLVITWVGRIGVRLAAAILLLFTVRRWLFLFVAGFTRPRPLPPPGEWPHLLIAIPFYNEAATLPACLEAIRQLDYPKERCRIIWWDDGSTDGCGRVIQTACTPQNGWIYQRVESNQGKAMALNQLLFSSHSDYAQLLVVYDADERPRPDALQHLITPFTDTTIGATSGRRIIGNGLDSLTATYATYEATVHQAITIRAKDRLNLQPPTLGSNCAYRLTALTNVGGFTPGAILEDSDVTVRLAQASWATRYVPQAISTTLAPTTLRAYWHQHQRWSAGFTDVALTQSHSQVHHPRRAGGWVWWENRLFSLGYLDRLATAVVTLAQVKGQRWDWLLAVSWLTPCVQVVVALWQERVAAAYWLRLPILPIFYLLDAAAAISGIFHSLARIPRLARPLQS